MKFFALLSLIFLISCAQVTSLNLRKHEFGQQPSRIIWFQIAGLEEEHIAMIRFAQFQQGTTSFENALCVGKTWDYSLSSLRNSASSEFMSQIVGKKNIKSDCSDMANRPVWSYLGKSGYRTGILEIKADKKESLAELETCEGGPAFFKHLHMWVMDKAPEKASTFHYAEPMVLNEQLVFYDRTCQEKGCFSSIANNYASIYEGFQRNSQKHLFIVRDYSYAHALKEKNFKKAQDILRDIEKSLAIAQESLKGQGNLILLTTGRTILIDLPDQGMDWAEFEKSGQKASVKRQKLMNTVLAFGARSENFCGIYEGVTLLERMLSGPKQQGLEFKFINPFKE